MYLEHGLTSLFGVRELNSFMQMTKQYSTLNHALVQIENSSTAA